MNEPLPTSASTSDGQPATRRGVPHRGGPMNPSVEALRAAFGEAIVRAAVTWGETTVVVARERVHDVIAWLRDTASERYDYLVDVTAVEYRDAARPLEVVWHLRSLPFRRFLRLKVELARGAPLSVPSVIDLYSGADWLERECYDMFGITFDGHPDLRRILLWEGYREGHPLRKDFPLRGRFSRAEQLSQALTADRVPRHGMEELPIEEALDALPIDMRDRLRPIRRPPLAADPDAAAGP